jgi:hypothetical protein
MKPMSIRLDNNNDGEYHRTTTSTAGTTTSSSATIATTPLLHTPIFGIRGGGLFGNKSSTSEEKYVCRRQSLSKM